MPWENCAIHGCTSSRKIRGLGIFKLPSDFKKQKAWRNKMIAVLKNREGEKKFQNRVKDGTVRICEKHFEITDVEIYTLPEVDPPRKRLKAGALPCRLLPQKILSSDSFSSMEKPSDELNSSSLQFNGPMHTSAFPRHHNEPMKYKPQEVNSIQDIETKKYRSFGVDTNDQKKTRNFCCQIGESFIKRRKVSS